MHQELHLEFNYKAFFWQPILIVTLCREKKPTWKEKIHLQGFSTNICTQKTANFSHMSMPTSCLWNVAVNKLQKHQSTSTETESQKHSSFKTMLSIYFKIQQSIKDFVVLYCKVINKIINTSLFSVKFCRIVFRVLCESITLQVKNPLIVVTNYSIINLNIIIIYFSL